MSVPSLQELDHSSRNHRLRLHTLTVLRWIAILGQIIAIEIAHILFEIQLNLILCYVTVGAAIALNLFTISMFRQNKWLTEFQTLLMLVFDISQLSLLLFLTGGLNNPFALLVLAPVTISASVLRLQSTLGLCALAMIFVTILSVAFVPLVSSDGVVLAMPDLFRFGFWVAIIIGVGFIALYARRVSTEIGSMSDALQATQMALAREQKLTDLTGVVAAAAHELGTPLATIKLVSTELIDELEGQDTLREDAELIREQANRCRDILHSMGRAGKDDLHMRQAPLDSVLREAADPHRERGKKVHFDTSPGPNGSSRQPSIYRRPEVIHGLRNLVQNAVDFSTENVWVEAHWSDAFITIRILDDGNGFPPNIIRRIGDPFMRSRKTSADKAQRPEYEGMGLGLFIAKTLLERTGARLTFENGASPFLMETERPEQCGAIVEVVWPFDKICPDLEQQRSPLGANSPMNIG